MGIQKTDLITDYYADQNRQLHESIRWGESGRKYASKVAAFSREIGARSLLDYGCGRRTLREALLNKERYEWPINEYDPALPEFSALPVPADIVVCTDVLEHVEPELLDNVLRHLYALSIKGAYMVIATRDTDHILPDGRSSHLIVEQPEWWLDRVRAVQPWASMHAVAEAKPDGTAKRLTVMGKK